MFDILIQKILQHEGGYVNNPSDKGGETKYGITKARYPNLDIKTITKAQAIEIYRKDFYIPLKISSFTNINLALNVFDMGVNAGKSTAIRLLNEAKEIQSRNTESNIVDIYKELRKDYYKKVALNGNNKIFLKGWLNRVESSNIA